MVNEHGPRHSFINSRPHVTSPRIFSRFLLLFPLKLEHDTFAAAHLFWRLFSVSCAIWIERRIDVVKREEEVKKKIVTEIKINSRSKGWECASRQSFYSAEKQLLFVFSYVTVYCEPEKKLVRKIVTECCERYSCDLHIVGRSNGQSQIARKWCGAHHCWHRARLHFRKS